MSPPGNRPDARPSGARIDDPTGGPADLDETLDGVAAAVADTHRRSVATRRVLRVPRIPSRLIDALLDRGVQTDQIVRWGRHSPPATTAQPAPNRATACHPQVAESTPVTAEAAALVMNRLAM